jgi:glucose-1-phosphate cytidylyltransferase
VAGISTVILCGGRGTRLREYTEVVPKVLVEVGDKPILWHVMQGYAHQGFADFVLALGYLGDQVRERMLAATGKEAWAVQFADTGEDTNTGARVLAVKDRVGSDVFFATYGDGVADIDLRQLLEFHRAHGRVATVSVVRPRLPFGLVQLDGNGQVSGFDEKPLLDSWINGGFFVFNRRVFDYLDGESVLERDPMARLAAEGQLMAYQHTGFWACMDTYKDTLNLNAAWAAGDAPWKTW